MSDLEKIASNDGLFMIFPTILFFLWSIYMFSLVRKGKGFIFLPSGLLPKGQTADVDNPSRLRKIWTILLGVGFLFLSIFAFLAFLVSVK